ncbi:unnamed protein product [Linum trigynum]|uniref:Leucine-rich repeat-containing N-terminal plant-type domain-containing protein n=1 Tax=Linum trigynum TaxID=586398 RepID=A0AAV2GJN2_9ROSI
MQTKKKPHHFSLLPLLLSFLSLHAAAVAVAKDGRSLISFKAALPNPPPLLSNWLPNKDPCSFNGVKCQGLAANRVSAVDLSFSPLSANFHTVAKFLLSIDSLESLTLQSANVSRSIAFPPGSKCSSVLTNLDLSTNSLSGPVSDVSGLAACPGLKSLNLSGNALDFSLKEKWNGGLKIVAGLESLDLSWNDMFDEFSRRGRCRRWISGALFFINGL